MMNSKNMKTVVLIHPIPTPYRQDLFNEIAKICRQHNINFIVLYEKPSEPRREHWIDVLSNSEYECHFLDSLSINFSLIKSVAILKPFAVKQLFSYRPQVIICTGFSMTTILALFHHYINKSRLMIWSGEKVLLGKLKYIRQFIRLIVLRETEHLFVYGARAFEFYKNKFNFPSKRMTTILNVIPVRHNIDCTELIEEKVRMLRKNTIHFVYVGSIVSAKGVYYLPGMMGSLEKTLPEYFFSLIIIGKGPEREPLHLALKKRLTRTQIDFQGVLPNQLVLDRIAFSHFLLFPTKEEPWGHVITEAFSVGTPVISSQCAGAADDMMLDHKNGFIADFQKPHEIAVKLKSAVTDLEGYKEMCVFCKKYYDDLYASLDNANRFFDVIKASIAARECSVHSIDANL